MRRDTVVPTTNDLAERRRVPITRTHPLRHSLRPVTATVITLALTLGLLGAAPVAAATQKVVIIVGPTGSLTSNYRSTGNAIAATAEAAGADVVKVYSPKATWNRVKAAVEGANIIVYLGHGNGYPNPYTSGAEPTDRDNGWGLNRTINGGDSDDWSTKMVYCGEKALLGTLTSSDAAQWQKCGGSTGNDGINPAPNFVMIYNKACYAPGAGEGWDTKATESQAFQRVRNYSYPVLAQGAGAYFATDMYQGGSQLVDLVLDNPGMAFGEIAMNANGYDASAQRHFDHPDVGNAEVWIQRTGEHGGLDYWFAYAGRPTRTPAGGTASLPNTPEVTKVSPKPNSKWAKGSARVKVWFDEPVLGVTGSTFRLYDDYGFRVPAIVRYRPARQLAVLRPRSELQPKAWYDVVLASGIHNADGVPVTGKEWSFRTRAFDGDGSVTNYPLPTRLAFEGGTHTGYRFSSSGKQTSVRTSTLAGPSGANTATRRTLPNQSGTWFYITNGLWAGYWMRESPALHLDGSDPPASPDATASAFDPEATAGIERGTHTGYRFDDSGAMTGEKTSRKWSETVASVSALEAIPNQAGLWFRVESGAWSGYMMRASDVVHLAPES